jgi:hypothetical protein
VAVVGIEDEVVVSGEAAVEIEVAAVVAEDAA